MARLPGKYVLFQCVRLPVCGYALLTVRITTGLRACMHACIVDFNCELHSSTRGAYFACLSVVIASIQSVYHPPDACKKNSSPSSFVSV